MQSEMDELMGQLIERLQSKVEMLVAALNDVKPFLTHSCPVEGQNRQELYRDCPRCRVIGVLLELEYGVFKKVHYK